MIHSGDMNQSKRLILGSTSPFRKQLLRDAGYEFDVIAPKVDEKSIFGLPPKELARKRAEVKGLDVAMQVGSLDAIVIGCDQVLGMDGMSFDKAASIEEARERLTTFSGRTHFLHSAYCLIETSASSRPRVVYSEVVDVSMSMMTLSSNQIESYLATDEWQGVVGCYRVEGVGKALFANLPADKSAIIGLPMERLLKSLSGSLLGSL
jgi:septum formation protein